MKFNVTKTLPDSLARTGVLELPHGRVQTPVFMPVGTQGAVKTLAPWEVEELGAEIILGNTYHLHLRPGDALIADQGGLNKWSRWDKPILTDSGGYQAYSLGETRHKSAKTTDDGVTFWSHIDGQKLHFTPESVLDIQANLGSDISMVLDDCPPIEATITRSREAINRTARWAERSINYWHDRKMARPQTTKRSDGERGNPPADGVGRAIFGIIQGGLFEEHRLESLNAIQSRPFDGIAVGGVAIASEGKEKINKAVEFVARDLDKSRPHYLMGVGEPEDLIRMVHMGMDMFDCVIPTRFARHGSFWLTDSFQRLSIELSEFATDGGPLDPNCSCRICQTFSRSYLRHLYVSKEMFAMRALSYHNLHLVLQLMNTIRSSILAGNFTQIYGRYLVH